MKTRLIKNIYKDAREDYRVWKSYYEQYSAQRDRSLRVYNWWQQPLDEIWLCRFIKSNHLLPDDKILNIVSVFGRKDITRYLKEGATVFFTGENIHYRFEEYADYCLKNNRAQLGLGFDEFESDNYLRFPLWLIYMFSPEMSEVDIRKRCEELRFPQIGNRTLFASMIARYDWFGNRMEICSSLENIAPVSCPSMVNHNDDTLKTIYHDDKAAYLQQFAFNICPENTNSGGYVTEKIFEAISSGCIPIYWGSYNHPEPEIINPEAVIYWDKNGDNAKNLKIIEDLWTHKNLLDEFLHQPRLLHSAEDIITARFDALKSKLEYICLNI